MAHFEQFTALNRAPSMKYCLLLDGDVHHHVRAPCQMACYCYFFFYFLLFPLGFFLVWWFGVCFVGFVLFWLFPALWTQLQALITSPFVYFLPPSTFCCWFKFWISRKRSSLKSPQTLVSKKYLFVGAWVFSLPLLQFIVPEEQCHSKHKPKRSQPISARVEDTWRYLDIVPGEPH